MSARQGFRIDATARTIEPVTFEGLEGLQAMVGGYIETAYQWDNGDALFVDEEGLLKPMGAFFEIDVRTDQAFAGNGILVGAEIGDTADTAPPMMTLEALRACVRFLDLADVRRKYT